MKKTRTSFKGDARASFSSATGASRSSASVRASFCEEREP